MKDQCTEYGEIFSKVYQEKWGEYALEFSDVILNYFENVKITTALDVCCGTGHFSRELAKQKIKVTGIDISKSMIKRAKENSGKLPLKYFAKDACNFNLNKKFNLVTSMYDSLNHLKTYNDLNSCFKSVKKHLAKDGYFVFDLNTKKYLSKVWDKWSSIDNDDDLFLITSGHYIEELSKAFTRVTGFFRKGNSKLYEKFDEKIFNTAFEMKKVIDLLKKNGFKQFNFYGDFKLCKKLTVSSLETAKRVFFVVK